MAKNGGTSKESSVGADVRNQDDQVFEQELLLNYRCGHNIRENNNLENLYDEYELKYLNLYGAVNEDEYPLKRCGSH
jgi:hypothetical protein